MNRLSPTRPTHPTPPPRSHPAPAPTPQRRPGRAGGAPLRAGAGLAPFVPSAEAPWDRQRALHLLRRTRFGATPQEADQLLASDPQAAVTLLLDGATSAPLPDVPAWATRPAPQSGSGASMTFTDDNRRWRMEYRWGVYAEALGSRSAATSLRERLAIFWHGHFVTQYTGYSLSSWLHRYWTLLRTHALGDFKQFVYDMGLSPAMLHYLNGNENRAGRPNENYARELLELFTMGQTGPDGSANYTQADIEEVARALTGWDADKHRHLESVFDPELHDGGEKTIFGQTGNWGYDDVIRILFEERGAEIAHFICEKLYRAFVYDAPNAAVVQEMADLFQASDFELKPVVHALLSSAHFFSDAALGARIKSPADHHLGLYREVGYAVDPTFNPILDRDLKYTGQELFNPPGVAGWDGHRAWLNTTSLTTRWGFISRFLGRQPTLRALAAAMPDPEDPHALSASLAEFLLGVSLSQPEVDRVAEILLHGASPDDWDPQDESAERRILGAVTHLVRLPEYQLT